MSNNIFDPLSRIPVPTTPYDTQQPPLFTQATELAKDTFVIEIRNFLNRSLQTQNLLNTVPTVRKYDFSFNSSESSFKTMATIVRKMPDLTEQLPVIAVLSTAGKNRSMGIGGNYVGVVANKTMITSANTGPYVLQDGMTLIYQTTSPTKVVHTSTVVFQANLMPNIGASSALDVANQINFQSLYANGQVNLNNGVDLSYGGPSTLDVSGDIQIVGGTALSILGYTVGQTAQYMNTMPYHRYIHASTLTLGIEVGTEDDNTRTELTDLLWGWLNFLKNDTQFSFWGRTIFQPTTVNPISNETYQVIIDPNITLSGENEVPRPNDDKSKIYINRIDVTLNVFQYIDRMAIVPGTQANPKPLYLDASKITHNNPVLPMKN